MDNHSQASDGRLKTAYSVHDALDNVGWWMLRARLCLDKTLKTHDAENKEKKKGSLRYC